MGIKELFQPNKELVKRFGQLQQTVLNWELFWSQQIDSTADSTTGNPYKVPSVAIAELSRKYEGTADWGCDQARTIVDVRSAFTIGDGIQVVEIDPKTKKALLSSAGTHTKEQNFIAAFIEHNNLDEEAVQEFAKEAEIEGRILFKLIYNEDAKNIDLRFLSYNTNHYKVITNAEDYMTYERVEYKRSDQEEVKLDAKEFVYKKFAGRVDKVNELMPKTATILRKIEALDKALVDLRKINELFASPTPHFDCDDTASAKALYDKIKEVNWKIGKFIVTSKARFAMVSADANGADSLIKEIVSLVKTISGVTGIPVHFLGLPDLMSNRSTSTDMFEMIIASTNREKKTWIGTYEEIFRKAMEMMNAQQKGDTFIVDVISCDIPQITAEKLKALSEVWLPLFQANVVDLDYMLSMVPNADPERIKAAAEKEAKAMLDSIKLSDGDDDDEPSGPSGD